MAERQRFELWKVLPPCRFSRPVLSTAQPSLLFVGIVILLNQLMSKYKGYKNIRNKKNLLFYTYVSKVFFNFISFF